MVGREEKKEDFLRSVPCGSRRRPAPVVSRFGERKGKRGRRAVSLGALGRRLRFRLGGSRRARRRGAREEPRARRGEAGGRRRSRRGRRRRASCSDPMLSVGYENDGSAISLGTEPMSRLIFGVQQAFPFPGRLGAAEKVANADAARTGFRRRARGPRPRRRRAPRPRGPPRGAREPAPRRRADRHLEADRRDDPRPLLGGDGDAAGRPSRAERADAPPPAAPARRGRRGRARSSSCAASSTSLRTRPSRPPPASFPARRSTSRAATRRSRRRSTRRPRSATPRSCASARASRAISPGAGRGPTSSSRRRT